MAMDTAPIPEPPPPPVAVGDERKAARWRNISWALLCAVLVIPAWVAGVVLFIYAADFFPPDKRQEYGMLGICFAAVVAVILGVVVAWKGLRRGWNTPRALHHGWVAATVLLVVVAFMTLNARAARIRPAPQDKAVLNNARQLAAAADQYFMENGVTTCALSDLVGPDKYLKSLIVVANETYPLHYTKGASIAVTGLAGVRTITYAP